MTKTKAKIKIALSVAFGLVCLTALLILVICGRTLLVLVTIFESWLVIAWAVTLVHEIKEYKEME